MNWLLWSALGTGAWLLMKSPSSVPPSVGPKPDPVPPAPLPNSGGPVPINDPSVIAVNQGGNPAPPLPSTNPKPMTVTTKTVVVGGRKYLVTRAGLGIYKVELASDPSVFQLITQTGPLQERGDPKKLAQLKQDETQFPGNLFA